MARRLSAELTATLRDNVSPNARRIGQSLDHMDRRVQRSTRSGAEVATGLGRAGGAMGLLMAQAGGIAAPIAGALGAREVIASAADFESMLTEIQKKAGATAAETAAMGEEIKALATDGSLAVPISEIAAAYERGAAAGIPVAELREFAALSVKAADGFGMSAEEVGNFAAKLKTGLGLTDDQVRRVFDLTNSLADAGIADESGIVDYTDRVGASLKTLGLSTEQGLALGATFLNLGMTAETAATGTDALVNRMLGVSQLTGKKRSSFEKYMGSVEEFSALVGKDANGALLVMLDRLKDLDKEDRTAFLNEFIGLDHTGKMLRLSEAVDEYRRNLTLAGDEAKWMGSLDASYALKLDDFWSQWQIAKNALEELAIDAGTMGMPAFQGAIAVAKGLIEEVGTGLSSLRMGVSLEDIRATTDAVGDLVGAISGLMMMGSGSDLSPLQAYFNQVRDAVNVITSGVGIAHDAAQAVGLASPDEETPEQRQARRQRFGSATGEFLSDTPAGRVYNALPNNVIPEGPERQEWMRDHEASGSRYAASPDPGFEARRAAQSEQRAATEREGAARVQSLTTELSTIQNEIREVDRLLGELTGAEQEVRRNFKVAPDPSAIVSLRAIGDEMERLVAAREALEVQADVIRPQVPAAPTPAPASTPNALPLSAPVMPPNIPVPTPRPEIAAAVAVEVQRATEAVRLGAADMQTALAFTAQPRINVDTASLRDALALASRLRIELNGLQQASNAFSNRFEQGRAGRLDTSAAMADLSRPG